MTAEKADVHPIAPDLLRAGEDSGSFHCGRSCVFPSRGHSPLSSERSQAGGYALDDAPLLGQALWLSGLTLPDRSRHEVLHTRSLQTRLRSQGACRGPSPRHRRASEAAQGPVVMSTKLPEETKVTSRHRAWW